MAQKYGYLANTIKTAQGFECIICGANPTTWTWSDQRGEAMCCQCGTPYQLLQRDAEGQLLHKPPRINIKQSWLPFLRTYWQETRQFTGLGKIILGSGYPECVEGNEKFNKWLDAHPEWLKEIETGDDE